MTSKFHLAEINVARMRYPIDAPEMKDFVDRLDAVNAVADRSDGFVWRLQDEAGDATSFRAFDDPFMLVNMSVWRDVDALWAYVYKTVHAKVMTRRREWFDLLESVNVALWWTPAGALPSLEEGKRRLEMLARDGPTPAAFDFKTVYDASGRETAPKFPKKDCA